MMWLDAYERRCRLLPGLLAVMPIAIAITALGIKDAPVVSAALGLLSLAGGPVLIASVVRRKGLAAQDALWRNWGGPPTTRFLRSRESSVSTVQREAWRQAIEVATNVSLLSARREKSNPERADDTIEMAVGKVRETTRTDAFPLIAAESRNYGFERNFYGIRVTGRIVAMVSVIVIAAVIGWRITEGLHPNVPVSYVLGATIDALILLGWYVFPSEDRVKVTAEKYAYQLLQGAVLLSEAASADTAHP